ncbi:conjugal transfer protein TraO [Salmonella enterica subsp. diarizonae]|nr:conjugal transfer protein TraO [Salmonella enterica subsp. diarizonae]
MDAEQDAGKSGKKLSTLIGLGLVTLLGGGYLFLSWFNQDSSGTRSAVNLNRTMTGAGQGVVETPRYRELLKADNDRGAAAAARNNRTFIASLPQGLDAPVTTTGASSSSGRRQTDTHNPSSPSGRSQEDKAAGEKRQERLQKLLARISAQQATGSPPVVAAAMWNRSPGTAGNPQPAPASVQTASLSTPRPASGIQLIPALTRVPGFIDSAVDSDNPEPKVIASIPAGQWAGAVLFSPGAKRVGNNMEIHFNRMSWRGMNLNVNAYALNEDNLMSSVAGNVNNRWFSHIVLPSVLGGVGGVGTLYKDANTQVIQGNFGSVTGRVGMPDGKAIAGVIAGGTAERGSQVLAQQLADEPYKQVTVPSREIVSILFVDPVMSNDTSAGTPSTPSPDDYPLTLTHTHTPPRPATLADAEAQTQTRLQAAIERRQAEIRRRYSTPQQETP